MVYVLVVPVYYHAATILSICAISIPDLTSGPFDWLIKETVLSCVSSVSLVESSSMPRCPPNSSGSPSDSDFGGSHYDGSGPNTTTTD